MMMLSLLASSVSRAIQTPAASQRMGHSSVEVAGDRETRGRLLRKLVSQPAFHE